MEGNFWGGGGSDMRGLLTLPVGIQTLAHDRLQVVSKPNRES